MFRAGLLLSISGGTVLYIQRLACVMLKLMQLFKVIYIYIQDDKKKIHVHRMITVKKIRKNTFNSFNHLPQ
jgi:hypothetical protein